MSTTMQRVRFTATEYMGRETAAVAVGRIVGFRREAGVKAVVSRRSG